MGESELIRQIAKDVEEIKGELKVVHQSLDMIRNLLDVINQKVEATEATVG